MSENADIGQLAANMVATGQGMEANLDEWLRLIAERGLAEMSRISATYNNRINRMITSFHVNHVTGDDTADGSEQSPLKTLKKALALTPPSGICYATIKSNYLFEEDLAVSSRMLLLVDDGAERELSFTRELHVSGAIEYRKTNGFLLQGNNPALNCIGLKIQVPDEQGGPGTYLPSNNWSPIFRTSANDINVGFYGCDIDIPDDPYCALMQRTNMNLILSGINMTGQNYIGRFIHYVDDLNGTNVSDLPSIKSNVNII